MRRTHGLQRAGLLSSMASVGTAFTFTFDSPPTQCKNATLNIVGDDGVPPYNVVFVASGSAPGGNEIRKIIDHDFSDKSTSVLVTFPSNSAFIAVVSDSRAFGSGGTTLSVNTVSSSDSACLPTTIEPGFFLYNDNATIAQCVPRRLAYSIDPPAQGKVTIYGVIPGGESFAIDMSKATRGDDGGMGITWVPNVADFTDMLLMAGDDRGRGAGGSTPLINVATGPEDCLSGGSFISTQGTPAGGVYSTATVNNGTNTGDDGGSKTNIGAIVGGVIGALVFVIVVLAGLLFWFWRRRRHNARNTVREKPDLTDDPRPLAAAVANNHDLAPEPFIVPPSVTSASRPQTPSSMTGVGGAIPPSAWARAHGRTHSASGRPLSTATSDESGAAPSTAGLSAWERKHGAAGGPQLRPVNVVQHEDAGEMEADTVELPPAYGNIRPKASPGTEEPPAAAPGGSSS